MRVPAIVITVADGIMEGRKWCCYYENSKTFRCGIEDSEEEAEAAVLKCAVSLRSRCIGPTHPCIKPSLLLIS